MRFVRSVFAAAFIVATSVSAQTNTATAFLAQVATKYPTITTLHSLVLNGDAQWTSGSLHESGAATLQAAADGSSSIQLNLNTASRTETRTQLDSSRSCQWTDSKTITHQIDGPDCYAALPWFAPILLIQPTSTVASMLAVSDDGPVTRDGSTRHQVTYLTNLQASNAAATKKLTADTRVSLLFDLETLLPSSVEYVVHGDRDLSIGLPVRVVYSDYRTISGVPVPYRIDRYVNNSLQLSIVVTNASVN